jgi:spore coat polysaccharide biosynthesis protein SpsF
MTEQEAFWAGSYGDEYTTRNCSKDMIDANIDMFSDILPLAKGVNTILELGCNRGLNLAAIEYLDPSLTLTGIDVNGKALQGMAMMFDDLKLEKPYMHKSSIVEYDPVARYDLVFTKGVLIHVPPSQLDAVYSKMYELSEKYIMVAEYYNPTPINVTYRGIDNKLWKRDFAGEMIDKFKLHLVSYGFRYHGDKYPHDDITWFLLEKV